MSYEVMILLLTVYFFKKWLSDLYFSPSWNGLAWVSSLETTTSDVLKKKKVKFLDLQS